MSANVIPFRRPARREKATPLPSGKVRVTGFAIVLQAGPGAVSFVTDHVELGLSPEEARELGRKLLELADDADAARGAQ